MGIAFETTLLKIFTCMHLFVCVYGGNADTTAHVWKSRDNWTVLVLTFDTWVLGTKLRSAGLAASSSTCKTI